MISLHQNNLNDESIIRVYRNHKATRQTPNKSFKNVLVSAMGSYRNKISPLMFERKKSMKDKLQDFKVELGLNDRPINQLNFDLKQYCKKIITERCGKSSYKTNGMWKYKNSIRKINTDNDLMLEFKNKANKNLGTRTATPEKKLKIGTLISKGNVMESNFHMKGKKEPLTLELKKLLEHITYLSSKDYSDLPESYKNELNKLAESILYRKKTAGYL